MLEVDQTSPTPSTSRGDGEAPRLAAETVVPVFDTALPGNSARTDEEGFGEGGLADAAVAEKYRTVDT